MKIAVGIICGGQSPEHDISILSAKNVVNAINQNKFIPHIIYIDKNGTWKTIENSNLDNIASSTQHELCIVPGGKNKSFVFKNNPEKSLNIDIAFPILHGQLGEDGTIQGLFRMLNLPFVGCGVLSCAISMDKDVTKRLLKEAGILTSRFLVFYRHERKQILFKNIVDQLKLPFFVKPTNAGSSIGVSKVKNEAEFDKAIQDAFLHDEKIILEEYIQGREIECAVLGNENPQVALPGEIIPHHEFYTYEAKYFDDHGASVVVPAELDKEIIKKFQQIALQVYTLFVCSGLSRIDFFLTNNNKIYVNEFNTLPGFTNNSMYPKCWQVAGVSYPDLIERLILFGLKKFHHEMAI